MRNAQLIQFILALVLLSCTNADSREPIALFDGTSLDRWQAIGFNDIPSERWRIENGSLIAVGREEGFFSIMTKKRYSNFILTLDYKIEEGANSGIKYLVSKPDLEKPGRGLGLEYQIWDDNKIREDNKKTGALYDIMAAEGVVQNSVGTFNSVKIVVDGNRIEHWHNGIKVVDLDRSTDEFKALVAKSKYSEINGFGQRKRGYILLQDEGGHRVEFKNITLTDLGR